MARVYLFKQPAASMKMLYVIDQAVGPGCPNLRDDVALVQFFLRAAMEDDKKYKNPTGPPLAADGNFGPKTAARIKLWQEQELGIAEGSFKPLQDGRIDAMTNRSGMGTRSNTRYAIVSLNIIYATVNGMEKHANIGADQRCPAALLPSIFWR